MDGTGPHTDNKLLDYINTEFGWRGWTLKFSHLKHGERKENFCVVELVVIIPIPYHMYHTPYGIVPSQIKQIPVERIIGMSSRSAGAMTMPARCGHNMLMSSVHSKTRSRLSFLMDTILLKQQTNEQRKSE